MHTVKLVPVRHRRIGVFLAPDPAHGGAQAEFNVETYRLLAPTVKIVRPGIGTAGGLDVFAIKSEIDGAPRLLPEVLSALWRGGEVPTEALPELQFRLGPEFQHPRDFDPVLERRSAQRFFWLAVGALLALVAAGLLLTLGGDWLGRSSRSAKLEFQSVSLANWLSQPLRSNIFYNTTEPVRALATVPLDNTGYAPPAERFETPPPPVVRGGTPPGYTLARVQATGEQRLVLVSDYERSLLPRVFLNGRAFPTETLALPSDALNRIAAGAQGLNDQLILCNHVTPRTHRDGFDVSIAIWVGLLIAGLVLLPLAFIALIVWVRQIKRRGQLRALRVRLGLPDRTSSAAPAVT
ncbi:MAG: hypothetical protein JO295_07405 [Verrucomicrobia bacterium]|nr:hypothetical protein [Verrucomicrobiota bacterium]